VNDNNAKAFPQVYGYTVQNCIISVPAEDIKSVPAKPKAPKKAKETVVTDDLTKIEGIVKKVAALLAAENIKTYKDLSKCTIKKLQLLLDGAGSKFSIYNPATWPKQAKLAAAGNWEELGKMQEEMKGTR
jgi:predicted flap endonuclease-1-like 5' DNA nuclease